MEFGMILKVKHTSVKQTTHYATSLTRSACWSVRATIRRMPLETASSVTMVNWPIWPAWRTWLKIQYKKERNTVWMKGKSEEDVKKRQSTLPLTVPTFLHRIPRDCPRRGCCWDYKSFSPRELPHLPPWQDQDIPAAYNIGNTQEVPSFNNKMSQSKPKVMTFGTKFSTASIIN